MGKVFTLSEKTYHQLVDLAQRQQRPVEEILRLYLAAYEEALYERAHQQMVADGVLVSLPAPPGVCRDCAPEGSAEISGCSACKRAATLSERWMAISVGVSALPTSPARRFPAQRVQEWPIPVNLFTRLVVYGRFRDIDGSRDIL